MRAIQGARARARVEITTAIKDTARRQLADQGAARLSLRAVARELGMVSSALYRYFPSRDDLLTALIIDAFAGLGAEAEAALERTAAEPDPLLRWREVARAARSWALAHPHEYALLYGSPVPGYAAPHDTIAPASRAGMALIDVVRYARSVGLLDSPEDGETLPEELQKDVARLRVEFDDPSGEVITDRLVAAWAELFGLISFDLFGHLHGIVEARDAFFDQAVTRLGRDLGMRSPGVRSEDPTA